MATARLVFTALNQAYPIKLPVAVQEVTLQHTGKSSSGGAASGTILVEGSDDDGANWFPVGMTSTADGTALASLAAAGGGKLIALPEQIRVRMSVAGDLVAVLAFKELP